MKQPKEKHLQLDEPSLENVPSYEQLEAKLQHLTEISPITLNVNFTFSVMFTEIFQHEMPSYELKAGVFGASRSGWTYHTAIAIAQICKILDLNCRFEAMGKRDAIIESKGEKPEVFLVAEWEWDYDDIFGSGKELDKLKTTCKTHKTADAFLLTYCPISKYADFLQRIAGEWIGKVKRKEASSLYLHVLTFDDKSSFRNFGRLKTVTIHQDEINIWNDTFL